MGYINEKENEVKKDKTQAATVVAVGSQEI